MLSEWWLVKRHPSAAKQGHLVLQHATKLRLTDDSLESLVIGKLLANDAALVQRFPKFESWPADAQLATHSMAWACGTAFRFPMLAQYLNDWNFHRAVFECSISTTNNPGIKPRNQRNAVLYHNAHAVVVRGLDPSILYWPRKLTVEDEPDTLPSIPVPRPADTLPDFGVVYAMPDPPKRNL
jgi:hypothetical protein